MLLPILTPRSCDGCTACCKTHAVTELYKSEGEGCVYCEVGKGCRIYAGRPKGCRDFECSLLNQRLPLLEAHRPDRLRVVFDLQISDLGPVLVMYEVTAGALKQLLVRVLTFQMLNAGVFVSHIFASHRHVLLVPWGKTVSEETRQSSAEQLIEIDHAWNGLI